MVFKSKITYLLNNYAINKYDEEDVILSEQSMMIQNIPMGMKLHQAKHHISAFFNEFCGRG